MTLEEVIETQAEIISLQNALIQNLAAALNVELAYNEEAERIAKLKEILEPSNMCKNGTS